jgi:hypothetical protein
MERMYPHFIRLLGRSWEALMRASSLSTFGFILFAFAIPILAGILTLAWHRRRMGQPWTEAARNSLRPLLFTFAADAILLLITYIGSAVYVVYDDHQSLVAQNRELRETATELCILQPQAEGTFVSNMKSLIGGVDIKVWYTTAGGSQSKHCAVNIVQLLKDINWKPSPDSPAELPEQRSGVLIKSTGQYENIATHLKKNLDEAGIKSSDVSVGDAKLGYKIEIIVGKK